MDRTSKTSSARMKSQLPEEWAKQIETLRDLIRRTHLDGSELSNYWTQYFMGIGKDKETTYEIKIKYFLKFIWLVYQYRRAPAKDVYFQLGQDLHCKFKQVLDSAIVHITLPRPFLQGHRIVSFTFLKGSITVHTDHHPFVADNVMIYEEMDIDELYAFITK